MVRIVSLKHNQALNDKWLVLQNQQTEALLLPQVGNKMSLNLHSFVLLSWYDLAKHLDVN